MSLSHDLVYYPDDRPGIRRKRAGRGFSYLAPDGTRIEQSRERRRIEALAVPPAYEDVWISPEPLGHLQATGRDARARKQYRYHPDWRAWRDRKKFDRLAEFGEILPALRARILRDLRNTEAGEETFAIAAILALIDRACLRVGHAAYARDNKTFGATTLQPRHVSLDDSAIELRFTAKGGDKVRKRLRDATLNRVLTQLDDLPGPELVSWIDDSGAARSITSEMVNGFLAEFTGNDALTAKTFRTWNGSAAALGEALKPGPLSIKAMAEAAAERLHNTPAIARKSYVHPDVVALSELDEDARRECLSIGDEIRGLRRSETALLHLLRKAGKGGD